MSRAETRFPYLELAANPEKWRGKPPETVNTEAAYYGAEHGDGPEQNKEGLFFIGYQYLVDYQGAQGQGALYPINIDGSVYPRDALTLWADQTPRDKQDKKVFEKVRQEFFHAPDNALVVWVSPAGETYPFPRLYLAELSPREENKRIINALDFNIDLRPEEIYHLLVVLDPHQLLFPFQGEMDLGKRVLTLLPQNGRPRQAQEIISALEKIGHRQIHGVPLEKIKEQLANKAWKKVLDQNKEIAQKMRLAPRIKAALETQNYYQALFYMAQFEQEIAYQGGSFARQSSCGFAISSIFAHFPRPQYGLPVFSLEITGGAKTCPVCGHTLVHPIPIGGHCPYCGAKRKC